MEGHKDEDSKGLGRPRRPVKAICYDTFGFHKQCVDLYCELANVEKSSLKKVSAPSLDDHAIKPEEFEKPGKLQKGSCEDRHEDALWSTAGPLRPAVADLQHCPRGLEVEYGL